MRPAASVIVPVGAVDRQLREQVSAIAAQSGEVPFEVVLACNSPVAADYAALAQLATEQGESWTAIDASGRRGPAHARNAGAAAASSDRLLFCDADDLVEPRWVAAMVDALEVADAATGPLPPFGRSEAILKWKPLGAEDHAPTYMGVPYMPSANLGVRRQALEEVGGFDERLRTSEDIAFSWALQVNDKTIGWSPGAVIHRRYRPGVLAMLRQHFAYGRGISRVLLWYGLPGDGEWRDCGAALWRGSGDDSVGTPSDHRSLVRRSALALGRAVGILEVGLLRRR